MKFPTELRLILNQYKDTNIDIINGYVVNIKNLTIYKEGEKMLEQEKIFRLEQLNKFKAEKLQKLEELKNVDFEALIEEKVANYRNEIANEIRDEHDFEVSKIQLKIDAIDEMILETEAIEVEVIEEEPVEEVPTEEIAVEEPVDETAIEDVQEDVLIEERPII